MQPIRGDWRLKIKASKKAAKTLPDKQEAPAKEVPSAQPAPNLAELNKGLPPGWQAIWDSTSKAVYYGNIVTKVNFFLSRKRYLWNTIGSSPSLEQVCIRACREGCC